MGVSNITLQSNMTAATPGGSTITSASTTKQFATSANTNDVQSMLTQIVPTGTTATAVDVGAVDLTRSHVIRFRNTSTDANIVVVVIGTIGATDRILGMMRAGCTYGPEEHPGSGFSLTGNGTGTGTPAYPAVSAGPTAYKLFAYTTNNTNVGSSAVVEVSVVQSGSLASTNPNTNGDVTA